METDKTVGGDPLRPRAAWEQEPVRVRSANLNADDQQPKPKPEQPTFIGGTDPDVPSATRQPGHPDPVEIVPGNVGA